MLSRRNVTEDNLVDQQREAEERLLIEMVSLLVWWDGELNDMVN